MNFTASVTLLWEPFGLDMEYQPASADEREHLANVVKLCGKVHTVMSAVFPKELHAEHLTDILVTTSGEDRVVLTGELENAVNEALGQFDVSRDRLTQLREAGTLTAGGSTILDFNIDDNGSGEDAGPAIRFHTELAPTGIRPRYYYLGPDGETYCCHTSSALMANDQPVRAFCKDMDGEANIHVRIEFTLLWDGEVQ